MTIALQEDQFDSTSTLEARLEALTGEDKFAEALRLVDRNLDRAHWPPGDRTILEGVHNRLAQRQNQRYEELHTRLNSYLSQPKLASQADVDELQTLLTRLGNVDDRQDRLDLTQRVHSLIEVSNVELQYERIRREITGQIEAAERVGDLGTARNHRDNLASQLTVWDERAKNDPNNNIANALITPLRELLGEVNRRVQAIAERRAVLTTQAGQANFWKIEEEYQRMSNPPPGQPQITQYPKMLWEDIVQEGAAPEQRYAPIGPLLPLPEWHDQFLDDAASFSKKKGTEKVALARHYLEVGRPLDAQQTLREVVEDDDSRGTKRYFHLPEELEQHIRDFLQSKELVTAIQRYQRADRLLDEAEKRQNTNLPAAWRLYSEALDTPLDLSVRVLLLQETLLKAVSKKLVSSIRWDRSIGARTVSEISGRIEELGEWLEMLPDATEQEELAKRLDPQNQLAAMRPLVRDHLAYCRLWLAAGQLRESKHTDLGAFDEGLAALAPQIENWAENPPTIANSGADVSGVMSTRAGYRTRWQAIYKAENARPPLLDPNENELPLFELYSQLRAVLQNRRDVEGYIARVLNNAAIFTPDAKDTDKVQLDEARKAIGGTPGLDHLRSVLDARYYLYEERNGADSLDLESHVNLMRKVQLLTPGTADEHSPAAQRLKGEQEIARRRQVELEERQKQTKTFRQELDRIAGLVSEETLTSFERAWEDLRRAASNAPSDMVADIEGAYQQVRTRATTMSAQLPKLYSNPLTAQAVSEIRKWTTLMERIGALEALSTLRRHFDQRLWAWEAINGASLKERFTAFSQLAEADPANPEWKLKAVATGLAWLVSELEALRVQLDQSPPPMLERGPETLLGEINPSLKPSLRGSREFQLKAGEFYAWVGDLANARAHRISADNYPPSQDPPADLLQPEQLDKLLAMVALRERINTWQQTVQQPDLAIASELSRDYRDLLAENAQEVQA